MNRQVGGTLWRLVRCEVQSEIRWWVVLISGDEGPFQPLNADWLTFFPVYLGVLGVHLVCSVVRCGCWLAQSSQMPVPLLWRPTIWEMANHRLIWH